MNEKENPSVNIYPFQISVIMAVYNVQEFIEEAIDSLITQSIGFENIQVILIDDGSPDNSGKLCDEYSKKYPENIIVLHKKNEGLAKARIDGIKLAQGKYLSFFDPDDILSPNAFQDIVSFFDKNYEDIDVVAMPLYFFGDKTGAHPLNNKFSKGTRIIDLFKEFECTQLSLASAVIKKEVSHLIEADSEIVTAEDAKELVKILLLKNKLGVVSEARYNYRKRKTSSVGGAPSKKGWYTIYLKNFSQYVINYSNTYLGFTPKYVQQMVMYDLQWKLLLDDFYEGILNDVEKTEFFEELSKVLKLIDDKIIMGQKRLGPEQKLFALNLKYGSPRYFLSSNEVSLFFSEDAIIPISGCACRIAFLKIENNSFHMDGRVQLYKGEDKDIDIIVKIDNSIYETKIVNREPDKCCLGVPIASYKGFVIDIPLEKISTGTPITVCLKRNEQLIPIKKYRFAQFSPVSKEYDSSYHVQNGWKIHYKRNAFYVSKVTPKEHLKCELKFLKEVWKRKKCGGRKAVLARIGLFIFKPIKKKPLWLISDRAVKADDNGLAFYEYLRKEHPEISTYFVILKECPDYNKVKKMGPVLARDSFKHKFLLLLSDYIISSHAELEIYNPFRGYSEAYRDYLSQNKFIFLQHGITKDDISGWLNKYNKNLYGFITAAKPEYNSIVNGNYHYTNKEVWLTGFPRFDRLYDAEEKQITIMPTWRRYLMDHWERESDHWILIKDFEKSAYFTFYNSLINDARLLQAAKELGYTIAFFPHPNLQDHINLFHQDENVIFLSRETNYRDIYAKSSLVVSDYSSAVFDFGYLRKPIIYAHFDAEDFFAGEHVYTKGYFDYERDGFGEVEYNLDDTVKRIIEYMVQGCKLKQKYRERLDEFFAFNDRNNCQRVYEKIIELEK